MSDTREQALRALRESIAYAADNYDGHPGLYQDWISRIDAILALSAIPMPDREGE